MLTGIGADDLNRLAHDLGELDKEFGAAVKRELREPVAKVGTKLRSAARDQLPSWLGADVASIVRVSSSFDRGHYVKSSPNSRFTQATYINAYGMVRHPLFGNRDHWYPTVVGGMGWWDKTADEAAPEAAQEFAFAVLRVVDRVRTSNFATTKVGRSTFLA